jgi:hypothetical protein
MSKKPEANYVGRVHRALPPEIHRQSMAFTFTNGTPDQYYDGPTRDLWVEYKWRDKAPSRACTTYSPDSAGGRGQLSTLQFNWLCRRHDTGQNAWVIVGTPEGGFVLKNPSLWLMVDPSTLAFHTPRDIANIIANYCNGH